MIIVSKKHPSKEEIDALVDYIKSKGLKTNTANQSLNRTVRPRRLFPMSPGRLLLDTHSGGRLAQRYV